MIKRQSWRSLNKSDLILVGSITRTHGVRGELKVLEGGGSSGAWRRMQEVFVGSQPENAVCCRVEYIRRGGRFAIMALRGVGNLKQAEAFKGLNLYISRSGLPPLEEGSYYASDLVGLEVVDGKGMVLGRLTEIFDNHAHEIYVVRRGKREILIPVVAGVVLSIDLEVGRLVVEPPEGLPGLPCGEQWDGA